MKRVLVTGANGFVGGAMCSRLAAAGVHVVAAVRGDAANVPGATQIVKGELHGDTVWDAALRDVSGVVHLAARVHVMDDPAIEPLAEFRRVNVDGTIAVARRAAASGVRRFLFVSSVKVNVDERETPYSENDPPSPHGPYAQSKLEAEQALRSIERDTGMTVAIVRPPLVYGPRVRANFLKLLDTIDRGLPLPFGRIRNRRSLIFVDNLVDAITACLTHPAAAGRTFLVSDGEDLSTTDLVRRLGTLMGVRVRLLPVSPSVLRLAARAAGRKDEIERLVGSLTVDSRAARQALQWRPPFTLQQGLEATVAYYRTTHAR